MNVPNLAPPEQGQNRLEAWDYKATLNFVV